MEIGLIADTHGYLDPAVMKAFATVDEIWHAGDFGSIDIANELAAFRQFRGVYGNIDDAAIRDRFPLDLRFECGGLDILMTHIAGHPGRYESRLQSVFETDPPDVLVCGHSHMLRVEKCQRFGVHWLNPGAAGHRGSHLERTLLKATIDSGELKNLRVIELGPRGRIKPPAE